MTASCALNRNREAISDLGLIYLKQHNKILTKIQAKTQNQAFFIT